MAGLAIPEKKIFSDERAFCLDDGKKANIEGTIEESSTQTDQSLSSVSSLSGNRSVKVISDRPSYGFSTEKIQDKSLAETSDYNFIYKTKTIISITSSVLSIFKSDLCKSFTLVKDFYSMFVSVYDFTNSDFTSIKSVSLNLFYLVESIVTFAVSILAYPIRIGIVLVEDICSSIDRSIHIIKCMQKGLSASQFKALLFNCCKIAKDILCIVGLVFMSLKLTLASVALGCIIGAVKAYHCIGKREYLDCLDNVLGCAVDVKDYHKDLSSLFHSYVPSALVA